MAKSATSSDREFEFAFLNFSDFGTKNWFEIWKNFIITDKESGKDCGKVTHERLTEPRVTMEWLLAEPRSFSNLPVFLNLNGMWNFIILLTLYKMLMYEYLFELYREILKIWKKDSENI